MIAMIPARIGSTRLKMKNLALLNGKPLIFYSINAAKESGIFDRIILNSDCHVFNEIANRYDIEFYLRPEKLGDSNTKSDDVVFDFMQKHEADIVAWINPISPLLTADEIIKATLFFQDNELDTLITVEEKKVHSIFNHKPINFSEEEKFIQTQKLIPVQYFNYSIMMWDLKTFLDSMSKTGYAFFSGNVGYFPLSKESSLIVKTIEDLVYIENIIQSKNKNNYKLEYDHLVKSIKND